MTTATALFFPLPFFNNHRRLECCRLHNICRFFHTQDQKHYFLQCYIFRAILDFFISFMKNLIFYSFSIPDSTPFFLVFFHWHDLWSLPGAGWFTVNAHSIKQVCFCQVSSRPSGCHGTRRPWKNRVRRSSSGGRCEWRQWLTWNSVLSFLHGRVSFVSMSLTSTVFLLVSCLLFRWRIGHCRWCVTCEFFFFGGKFLWHRSVGAHGLQSRDEILLNTLGTCHAVECTRRCGLLCGRTFTGEPITRVWRFL